MKSDGTAALASAPTQWGSSHAVISHKPAITLSRKDCHSHANRAVVWTYRALARISHTIFAQSGSFAGRFASFVRNVLARGVRDASGAGTFHGLRGREKVVSVGLGRYRGSYALRRRVSRGRAARAGGCVETGGSEAP